MELRIGRPARPAEAGRQVAAHAGKRCANCGAAMAKLPGATPEGFPYSYFRCHACGEEIATKDQLHEVSRMSGEMKSYSAKVTQWGRSVGIRIPKELAVEHGLSAGREVSIMPALGGFRIVPVKRQRHPG